MGIVKVYWAAVLEHFNSRAMLGVELVFERKMRIFSGTSFQAQAMSAIGP
jgi:hypothetical protein